MKAKTLLIAAAALAATVISSEAQVYSANIVGYVNVPTTANQFFAVANPLDLDGVNSVTNVLKGIPNGSSVQIWNGSGYTLVTKALFGGAWSANAATNLISPGVGFFLKTPSAYTNTFVGNVIPATGATNGLPLLANINQFVGSPLAVAGKLTDAGPNTLNLGASLANGSSIQVWNGAGYTLATKSLFGGTWNTNLTINVGQCFFVKPAAATTWSQTITNN